MPETISELKKRANGINITSELKKTIAVIPELFEIVEKPSFMYRVFNKFRKDLSLMTALKIGLYKKIGQWDSEFSRYIMVEDKKDKTNKKHLLLKDSLILELMELGKAVPIQPIKNTLTSIKRNDTVRQDELPKDC